MKQLYFEGVFLRSIFVLAAGIGLTFFLRCDFGPVGPIEETIDYEALRISNLSVSYDAQLDKVLLQWDAVDTSVNFVRIYRTSAVDINNNPVEFTSTGSRTMVDSDTSSFYDIVGNENTVYYYYTRSAKTILYATEPDSIYDTILGPISDTGEVFVGRGVSFAINQGDIFLTIDTCSLTLRDLDRELTSVRFTDSATGADQTPVFYGTSYPVTDTLHQYQWILPQGGGEKVVWGEVTYADGTIDSLRDDIQIRPYRVEIKLRNEVVEPNHTMRKSDSKESVTGSLASVGVAFKYYVYKPWLRYAVSIFSDSTFNREFITWIAVPDSGRADNALSVPSRIGGWLETNPRTDSLTGYGSNHDDLEIYTYQLHPDSSEGKENLSRLMNTTGAAGVLRQYPDPSVISVPGLYWGDESVGNQYDSLTGDSAKTYFNKLKAFSPDSRLKFGAKPFTIVCQFTGRYFGETRTVVSSRSVNDHGTMLSVFDFYAPQVNVGTEDYQHDLPEGGEEVGGAFRVYLFDGAQDRGFADVKSIDLVVSSLPDSIRSNWKNIYPTLSESELKGFRHKVFSIVPSVPGYQVAPLEWQNIDLSLWPTGYYMMAFVTEDEFGNREVAQTTYWENPWYIRLRTAY